MFLCCTINANLLYYWGFKAIIILFLKIYVVIVEIKLQQNLLNIFKERKDLCMQIKYNTKFKVFVPKSSDQKYIIGNILC